MNDRKSINIVLVELLKDLAERADEVGFVLKSASFDVPGTIGSGYESMKVEFCNFLPNAEVRHGAKDADLD